jgi:hypothetical protein
MTTKKTATKTTKKAPAKKAGTGAKTATKRVSSPVKSKAPRQGGVGQIQVEAIMAASPFFWACFNRINLQGGVFEASGHEYLEGPLNEFHPDQVGIKGSQMGWTEGAVLKTLHGMIHRRYPKGVLYLFPTGDDVSDFSKARFNPLIEQNPDLIGGFVEDTDSINIKRIHGAMLYLRGARATKQIEGLMKTSSKLKSVPVDRVVLDERDEMDTDMVEMALERMAHSTVKEVFALSTPTIPDYGVDRAYRESDQRKWFIRCAACGHDTCLEEEFPACLKRDLSGRVYRACVKCGKEIFPRDGRWVATVPSCKERVGWHISQLNSVYVDPGKILAQFERIGELGAGERQIFYNSKLARAFVDGQNKLTPQDFHRLTTVQPMLAFSPGPSAMGVDVGSVLHCVIGLKIRQNCYRIVHVGRYKAWNDLHEVAKRYGVMCGVIDMKPELHKAREFQKAEPYEIFLCDYQESQKGAPHYDLGRGIVSVNRTEILDQTHSMVSVPGRMELPSMSSEIEQFVRECCASVKVMVENSSGEKVSRYKEVGADHYRHALGYMKLAANRIPVASEGDQYMDVRVPMAVTDYDIYGSGQRPLVRSGYGVAQAGYDIYR